MFLRDNFCTKPSDILLSSHLKSGTTWLKALSFATATRTKFKSSASPLLTTMPHYCVPFLESDLLPDSRVQRDPELPLLATHLPYTSLPRSIIASGCKIVYIYRDAKDVFVSHFHFMLKFMPELGLSEYFELFVKGVTIVGPFWDHVLSYWRASIQRPETIRFLFYENLMYDTEFYVKELAKFMGCPSSVEEEKGGDVKELVKLCCFENLSSLDVNRMGKYNFAGSLVIDNNYFFRKGQLEDWKNYLTPEMAEEIDKITEEKFGSCGLMVCHH